MAPRKSVAGRKSVGGAAAAHANLPAPLGKAFRPELEKYCRAEPPLSKSEIAEIQDLLQRHGTLDVARAKCKDKDGKFTGSFSASAANAKGDHRGSSMFGSWLRDNCIIAYGLYVTDPNGAGCDDAKACLNCIANFLMTHEAYRMELVIGGHKDVKGPPASWMDRPHIRFIGETGLEDTKWYNHKQNDALGYFLWTRVQLALSKKMPITGPHLKLLGQLFEYLRTIECWEDYDAGHWEEHSAQHASSLGPCLAAVRAFKRLLKEDKRLMAPCKDDTLDVLEKHLTTFLHEILPFEVIRPGEHVRDADSALIFLCYPLQVVDDSMGLKILNQLKNCIGHIAMARYRADSYWCKDYKLKIGDDPTKHFTDEELKARDALLAPGQEAQWCLFDPMVSAYYGKLYQKTKKPEYLRNQQLFLARSLAAITGDECEFGPWMCCEAYYMNGDKWEPNDNTPLLWTQIDLKMALMEMENSLGGARKRASSAGAKAAKKPRK